MGGRRGKGGPGFSNEEELEDVDNRGWRLGLLGTEAGLVVIVSDEAMREVS